MKFKRTTIAPEDVRDANLSRAQYDIDQAAWIWHPDAPADGASVRFTLETELDADFSGIFHISGDNRFEFFIDGEYVCMGPDRSDTDHWSFASYEAALPKGRHTLTALVHWYGTGMPLAQMSLGAGFVLAVSGENGKLFDTGKAPWKCALVRGLAFAPGGWATGNVCDIDVSLYHAAGAACDPAVVRSPIHGNPYGALEHPRRLHPSPLPEQMRRIYSGVRKVRGVVHGVFEEAVPFNCADTVSPELATWNDFFNGRGKITVKAGKTVNALVDFEAYLCAFPALSACGGDAAVRVSWAESLYDRNGEKWGKGNRGEVTGKWFRFESQYDIFRHFGTGGTASPVWWRAGRYVLLTVTAEKTDCILERLVFEESRYPLENESHIELGDQTLDAVEHIAVNALQACSHETFMDCPYYEQMMYTGDTRLELLATYTLTRDPRLALRAAELFSWSQSAWNDLVSERYPSSSPQLSGTFSLIWPLMVRDYMMYRRFERNSDFIVLRSRVRRMMTAFAEYVNADGLIENMPGWSFCDWVPGWDTGIPAGGDSKSALSIYSLHYLLALKAAAELEKYLPDGGGAFEKYYETCYERTRRSVIEKFYVREKALFANDTAHSHFSVHAQALALLADVPAGADAENTLFAMLGAKDAAQPTVYFIFYLFEALKKYGFADKILDYTGIWTDMMKSGAVTTWEMPEPTRSDCHAWGSHLYYHYFAGIAGIRPDSPGFRTVRATPAFGRLTHIKGTLVHPDGEIVFDLEKDSSGRAHGFIRLPDNVTGRFACGGCGKLLSGGMNEI